MRTKLTSKMINKKSESIYIGCIRCGLTQSSCELGDKGDEWIKNCMKVEGQKHTIGPIDVLPSNSGEISSKLEVPEIESYSLLEKAPSHNSPEFINFLRKNNVVVWENNWWIVIENCKYHTSEKPWYTAFYKYVSIEWNDLRHLLTGEFAEWEWLKKAKSKQTVRRFHIHLIKK